MTDILNSPWQRASMRPRHSCRGRLAAPERFLVDRVVASMRPRHSCRGRLPCCRSATQRAPSFNEAPAFLPGKTAQGRRAAGRCRAPGFNEAPAFLPGKTSRSPETAFHVSRSFNEAPAFLPGKTDLRARRHRPIHLASMRPRHSCRGRPRALRHQGRRLTASMRPRHSCRGRLLRPCSSPRVESTLQ